MKVRKKRSEQKREKLGLEMPWNQEESTPRERGKVARIAANDGLAELAHKMPLSWCECLANVGGFKPFCRHDCKRRNPILSSSSNRSNKKIWSQSLLEFISCTTDSTRSPCSWPEQLWPSPKRRIQRGQNGQNPSARIILCVWIRNSEGLGNQMDRIWIGDLEVGTWWLLGRCRRMEPVCRIRPKILAVECGTKRYRDCFAVRNQKLLGDWLCNRRWFRPIHKENLETDEIWWNASKRVRLTTHPAPRIGLTRWLGEVVRTAIVGCDFI